MVDVLRAVSEPDLLAAHPNLIAYVERGTAPAGLQTRVGGALGRSRRGTLGSIQVRVAPGAETCVCSRKRTLVS